MNSGFFLMILGTLFPDSEGGTPIDFGGFDMKIIARLSTEEPERSKNAFFDDLRRRTTTICRENVHISQISVES